ncbi:uroporphyrinogen-III synthase [Chelatococcus sp. SYSU_G07232]|uniref:Uroporphyrinogen-III synthase n=1 Tax=Chelatococcus albus TaxID=3047466 RepID=A0ABT7AK81_9HYPH|nr:uroporphyrinogen-III synthase [Chelatococcus sp. SYSU_G07232]MDJ1159785.1 uroporphyrinogen-III synthase [Chelatococcus sp. SYSU_G07232]
MRVLVLRPLADAERTAARLAARGHEAVCAPVLAVRRTEAEPPSGPFDALVLTSANALVAVDALPQAHRCLPVLAVGRRTGKAAQDAGFAPVHCAEGDRLSLARLAAGLLRPGSRLLMALGRDHKEDTLPLLTAAGFAPVPWIAYAAEAAPALPAAGRHALAGGRVEAVLHYSRRSAAIGLALARAARLEEPFLACDHVCLSQDVAEPLARAGAQHIVVAAVPDEDCLLAALDGLAARTSGAPGSPPQPGGW